MIGTIAKAVVGAFVAAGTTAITALQNGHVGPVEWLTILGAFLVAFGAVWAVPNIPESVRVYGKAVTAALVAAAGAGVTAFLNGSISVDEWITIAIAFAGGLGLVYAVPNAAASDVFDEDFDGGLIG